MFLSRQNDVTRLESDLIQATQELRRVQQALLKQSESHLEEQRRRSRQEAPYLRTKDSERTGDATEKATRNRISMSAESGGSSTDSEEYGAIESSETEEVYTPKERPSSLVVDVDEGPRDQVTMMAALVSDFHKAEKQEAVAVSNEGLVTLQRAEVRKVTDVDSAEVDQFMQRIDGSAETTINGVTSDRHSRSGTKEVSPSRRPRTDGSLHDFDQEVGMTEIAEELPTGNVVSTEHWEDTTLELAGTLENTMVMATRLDDLLNEDRESDQETVVASGSFLNTSPEIDSSQDVSTSVDDTGAILRRTNDGTEIPHQDRCSQDSLENVVNVEMNSYGNTAMILTGVGTTPPQTLLDVSSGDSRPTSLVSVDSLACDEGSDGSKPEEVTVVRSADETKNSGAENEVQDVKTTESTKEDGDVKEPTKEDVGDNEGQDVDANEGQDVDDNEDQDVDDNEDQDADDNEDQDVDDDEGDNDSEVEDEDDNVGDNNEGDDEEDDDDDDDDYEIMN